MSDQSALLKEFLIESSENLSSIGEELSQFEQSQDQELIRSIYRKVHTLKGSASFLGFENLKKLGFQTFDSWWDEGYSNDCADAMFVSIKQNIDWIASQSRQTIETWYKEMQPVLENNVTVLNNLTNERITHTKFDHE